MDFHIFVNMNDQLQDTKDFLQDISDEIHFFVAANFPDGAVLIIQILIKLLLLFGLMYALDLLLKLIINAIFKIFLNNEDRFPVMKSISEARITNSVAHLLSLQFGAYALYSIFARHPKSFKFLETTIDFVVVVVLANLGLRVLKAFEKYYLIKKDYYRIVALRSISQTVRIFGGFIFSVIAICVVFRISSNTILGSLGAVTAVLVLVFRDTILGFVTGIHVATSKNLKEGDWISIPKYNLEGTIEDISLLTTKIQNFDKTMSTIPTYDLLSTEIKNLQVMSESNTRRIKKSIIFDIRSFRFLDEELFQRLSEINLIHNYLEEKSSKIKAERQNLPHGEKIINGEQLTNIGTFRIYAYHYLKNNPHIDQSNTIIVRQMDITPQGLPLEIYCFANDSRWERFEQIQSDIFDHLLVASKEFELEVMQIGIKV